MGRDGSGKHSLEITCVGVLAMSPIGVRISCESDKGLHQPASARIGQGIDVIRWIRQARACLVVRYYGKYL